MMHYTQYTDYHVGLLKEFKEAAQTQAPFILSSELTEDDNEFINTLNTLCQTAHYTEVLNEQGQWLVGRIISAYSHLTPLLPRDLLWFFGGDCLHYMPDDEIRFYQQLDELRFTAEKTNDTFDYLAAKASLSKPH
jgi:hypothetical protein